MPHVIETIRALGQTHALALCSGSTRAQVDIVLQRFKLSACFEMTV